MQRVNSDSFKKRRWKCFDVPSTVFSVLFTVLTAGLYDNVEFDLFTLGSVRL